MTAKKLLRRFLYEETENEIVNWGKQMQRENRLDKAPNGQNKSNFPFYLEQYIKHLKFEAKK